MEIPPTVVGQVAQVRDADLEIFPRGIGEAEVPQKSPAVFFPVGVDFRNSRYLSADFE